MSLLGVYTRIMRLYPKSYQEVYGHETTQTLLDMVHDSPSRWRRAAIWCRAFLDLPVSVARENIVVVEQAYFATTPEYVKRNSEISAFMLAPFFLLLVLNEALPRALPQTPTWNDILQFLVIGLPIAGFTLCLATYATWIAARRHQHRDGTWRSLHDISHNWPLIGLMIMALAIPVFMLGHDSGRCLAGNPLKEIRNMSATYECLRRV